MELTNSPQSILHGHDAIKKNLDSMKAAYIRQTKHEGRWGNPAYMTKGGIMGPVTTQEGWQILFRSQVDFWEYAHPTLPTL